MATILTSTPASTLEIDARLLREWPLPEPGAFADKEERGSLLVLAGSRETPGAASLAAMAGLRAGAGKLTVATVASLAGGFGLSHPEARIVALPETDGGGFAPEGLAKLETLLGQVDAVLVGPGLMDGAATRAFTRRVVKRTTRAAIVLDALAMDLILDVRRFERPPLLTPHAGEMAHLIGVAKELIVADPERYAREAALRWNAVVALKGASTFVATPDGSCWCHASTHIGLATSGSGDVLAGIVAGLATRGAPLAQAAAWGVALHSRAGRALAERIGPMGYLASELAAEVPRLMQRLAH
jgi:ADP-dependent NAD(P)H-hydrate dehydratase